jgi:hypothetical protein
VDESESNPGEVALVEAEVSTSASVASPIVRGEREKGHAGFGPALFFGVAGWVVPGLGHLLQGRWGRACVFVVAVGGLAVTGLMMRGNVFPLHSEDPFGTLGFVADAGSGVFYYFARFIEPGGADLSRTAGEFGTRLIAAAGIVNILSAIDAYEIAAGRRR